MDLQLFLAKKSNNEWLSADTELSTAAFDRYGRLTLDVDGQLEAFEQMHPLQSLNDYFGADFESRSGQVHVLVVIPKKLWLVTATIQNALEMIGIRARLYAAAAQSVGFYDPALRSDGQDRAFWYERDATLHIRVVFDTSEILPMLLLHTRSLS